MDHKELACTISGVEQRWHKSSMRTRLTFLLTERGYHPHVAARSTAEDSPHLQKTLASMDHKELARTISGVEQRWHKSSKHTATPPAHRTGLSPPCRCPKYSRRQSSFAKNARLHGPQRTGPHHQRRGTEVAQKQQAHGSPSCSQNGASPPCHCPKYSRRQSSFAKNARLHGPQIAGPHHRRRTEVAQKQQAQGQPSCSRQRPQSRK